MHEFAFFKKFYTDTTRHRVVLNPSTSVPCPWNLLSLFGEPCVFMLDLLLGQVITAQYFVWFFCLLPLILPWSNMKLKWQGLCCVLLWMGAQTHWLMWGYLLEFKGKNVFLQLWMGSILFLAANTFFLIMLIRHHNYSPVFRLHGGTKRALKCE